MFRRELELARDCGEQLLSALDRCASPDRRAELKDLVKCAESALEPAWRMESALGEFLAVTDVKARVTGFLESKDPASRAFRLLKEGLEGAAESLRKSEAELSDYLSTLRGRASQAQSLVEEALSKAPPAGAWQYRAETTEAQQAEQRRATVVIKRDPQKAHSFEGIRDLVAAALEPLGGMSAFVKPGQTVLIKPNLTLFFLAEEGVTTDPRVVAALARLAKEAGAAKVIVGESSGGGTATLEAMEVTGIAHAAQQEGAELIDFHTCEQREVEINGRIIKRILLPAPLLDADVIINAPKAKTHHMDFISCALKAWVGVLRADIRSAHHDWETYQTYVDIMTRVRPTLNVVDAIYLGEGDGPGANEGRFYGGIIASIDPVATDCIVAELMGFDSSQLAFLQIAKERGLGVGDPTRIDIVGLALDEARVPVKKPRMGLDYIDANIIVGSGVSRPGALGHFKSSADIWLKMGVWKTIIALKGKPTILIGDAEDPLFEQHLREGPYIVIDDVSPQKYRQHPQVTFIPGHPALHNILPQLMEGLGVSVMGETTFKLMQVLRNVESSLRYSRTPAAPLAAAPAAVRRMPVVAQYSTLGALAVGLLSGLVWSTVAIIGGLRRRSSAEP